LIDGLMVPWVGSVFDGTELCALHCAARGVAHLTLARATSEATQRAPSCTRRGRFEVLLAPQVNARVLEIDKLALLDCQGSHRLALAR